MAPGERPVCPNCGFDGGTIEEVRLPERRPVRDDADDIPVPAADEGELAEPLDAEQDTDWPEESVEAGTSVHPTASDEDGLAEDDRLEHQDPPEVVPDDADTVVPQDADLKGTGEPTQETPAHPSAEQPPLGGASEPPPVPSGGPSSADTPIQTPDIQHQEPPSPGTSPPGMPIAQEPSAPRQTPAPKSGERVFYSDHNGVVVTSTRFIVGPKTYLLTGMTSVTLGVDSPSRAGPGVLAVFGILLMFLYEVSPGAAGFGFILLLIAIVWYLMITDTYTVQISTAAQEIHALKGERDYIQPIVEALNEAVIYRG